jgi:Co/Zn/Cd efflux system component
MSENDHTHESSQPYKRDHQNSAHGHSHTTGHGHTHSTINPSILTNERGMWAVKWSFVGLLITTLLQAVVVVVSGSVALLADTIHNLGDSLTAIPLAIAFALARRKPSKRFSYGYGRVEDLAGDGCGAHHLRQCHCWRLRIH